MASVKSMVIVAGMSGMALSAPCMWFCGGDRKVSQYSTVTYAMATFDRSQSPLEGQSAANFSILDLIDEYRQNLITFEQLSFEIEEAKAKSSGTSLDCKIFNVIRQLILLMAHQGVVDQRLWLFSDESIISLIHLLLKQASLRALFLEDGDGYSLPRLALKYQNREVAWRWYHLAFDHVQSADWQNKKARGQRFELLNSVADLLGIDETIYQLLKEKGLAER